MSDLKPELEAKINTYMLEEVIKNGDITDDPPSDIAVALGLIADASNFGGGPLKILHSIANYYHDNPILAADFVAYMGGIPA